VGDARVWLDGVGADVDGFLRGGGVGGRGFSGGLAAVSRGAAGWELGGARVIRKFPKTGLKFLWRHEIGGG
jgi:hypothetical protein